MSSLSECSTLGHQHPRVVEAIVAQARSLCFVTSAWGAEPRARLAQRLLDLAGFDGGRVLFTLGGADANENAVKLARWFTGPRKADRGARAQLSRRLVRRDDAVGRFPRARAAACAAQRRPRAAPVLLSLSVESRAPFLRVSRCRRRRRRARRRRRRSARPPRSSWNRTRERTASSRRPSTGRGCAGPRTRTARCSSPTR